MVTLTTDYGLDDPYVAQVKGVILSLAPDVQIVDITHSIPSFNERAIAFILMLSCKYFPSGTVHVCIVDPKVGTKRRSIIIDATDYYFVGPDTGIMYPAANKLGIKAVYEIDENLFSKTGFTFAGRDVYAVVAAKLSLGHEPLEFGSRIHDIVKLNLPEPRLEPGKVEGEVMHVDKFGNIITNISKDHVATVLGNVDKVRLKINDNVVKIPLRRTYGEVNVGELVIVEGGTGYLEISVNMGNASKRLATNIGDKISIENVT